MPTEWLQFTQSIANPLALVAVAILGTWQAIKLKKMEQMQTKHRKVTESVAESIVTNHGSKNLGDAVDRLTEKAQFNADTLVTLNAQIQEVKQEMTAHVRWSEGWVAAIEARVTRTELMDNILGLNSPSVRDLVAARIQELVTASNNKAV